MIEIKRPSIPSAYEALWKRVWHYGKKDIDERGDAVRVLHYVWVEITSDDLTYPSVCYVNEAIGDSFVDGLTDSDLSRCVGYEFDYGYGDRLRQKYALATVVEMLRENHKTRRGCIPITESNDLRASHMYNIEIPCATQVEFEVVDDKLDMVLHMRSNDVLNAFPSDVYGFRHLQMMVCDYTGIPIGNYYQYIKNAHIIEHAAQDWIEEHL
jgi:thymidylate synthase